MLFPRPAVISCQQQHQQQQQQQQQLQQKPSQAVSCNSETAITAQKRNNITEAATAMTYENNSKTRRDLTNYRTTNLNEISKKTALSTVKKVTTTENCYNNK